LRGGDGEGADQRQEVEIERQHGGYRQEGGDRSDKDQKSLAANIAFAEDLGAKVIRVRGRNIADAVAKVMRDKRITQVLFGRSADKGLRKYLYLSAEHRFLREAPAVDVHILTHESD
jgi:two-component system sensor histidine kinase KdpD